MFREKPTVVDGFWSVLNCVPKEMRARVFVKAISSFELLGIGEGDIRKIVGLTQVPLSEIKEVFEGGNGAGNNQMMVALEELANRLETETLFGRTEPPHREPTDSLDQALSLSVWLYHRFFGDEGRQGTAQRLLRACGAKLPMGETTPVLAQLRQDERQKSVADALAEGIVKQIGGAAAILEWKQYFELLAPAMTEFLQTAIASNAQLTNPSDEQRREQTKLVNLLRLAIGPEEARLWYEGQHFGSTSDEPLEVEIGKIGEE